MSGNQINSNSDDELGIASIPALLCKYSIPSIFNVVITVFYSFIDAVFLSWAIPDGSGVAVITLAMPITFILLALGLLIGQGGNALTAIYLGKNESNKAIKCIWNSVFLFLVLAILMIIIANFLLDQVLLLVAVPENLLQETKDFVSIQYYGAIFCFLSMGLGNFLRSLELPLHSLFINFISILVCIVFNWLLVLQLDFGVIGSAFATVIGQFVGSVFVITLIFVSKNIPVKIDIRDFCVDFYYCKTIVALGMSSFILSISNILIGVVFNWVVLHYGSLSPIGVEGAFATIGVVQRLSTLLYMPIVGISVGVQPIIGFNYGAGKIDRVVKVLRLSIIVSMAYGFIVTVSTILISHNIVSIINLEWSLQDFAAFALSASVIFYTLVGFQIQGGAYFQSSGQPIKSMLLESTRQVLFLIPMYVFLPLIFTSLGIVEDGLYAIVLCPPIADLLSFSITAIFIKKEIKSLSARNNSRI